MRTTMLTTVLLGAGLSVGLAGVSCGGDSNTLTEQEAQAICEDYAEVYCEKLVECEPTVALLLFGVSNASGCAAAAKAMCETDDGGGDDDCTPEVLPTDAQIQQCLADLDQATCEQLETAAETGTCGQISDMLECEDEPDAGQTATIDAGSVTSDAAAVAIDTAACEAAALLMCDVAAVCCGDYPLACSNGSAIATQVANCTTTLGTRATEVQAACQDYLAQGVAASAPVAVWLNNASPSDLDCVDTMTCSLTLNNIVAYLAAPSAATLEALIEPMLGSCVP